MIAALAFKLPAVQVAQAAAAAAIRVISESYSLRLAAAAEPQAEYTH
jgi:hypothetical protein